MYPRPNILPDQKLGLPRSGQAKPETNAAPGLLSLCHPSVTSIGGRLIASGVSAPMLRGREWRIPAGRASSLVEEIGRAPWRERGGTHVESQGVAVLLKKKKNE